MHKIIETKDGSKTIFVPELNETYHSIHGAHQEAIHVFIKHGIQLVEKDVIKILEVGFGTGLNAVLACEFAEANQQKIEYTGIEKFPVEAALAQNLAYDLFLSTKGKEYFNQMHLLEWGKWEQMNAYFTFKKEHCSIQDFHTEEMFDIVFFDAFAPEKQPEMWTEEVFKALFNKLNSNGILTTYCAKGQFKRTLKAAGFDVKAYPGPPGKREMTVGKKV